MPTLSPNAVESFTLIALINYVFSIILRNEAESQKLKARNKKTGTSSIQKTAKVFRALSGTILSALKKSRKLTKFWISTMIKKIRPLLLSVFDPNCDQRKNSINRLLQG